MEQVRPGQSLTSETSLGTQMQYQSGDGSEKRDIYITHGFLVPFRNDDTIALDEGIRPFHFQRRNRLRFLRLLLAFLALLARSRRGCLGFLGFESSFELRLQFRDHDVEDALLVHARFAAGREAFDEFFVRVLDGGAGGWAGLVGGLFWGVSGFCYFFLLLALFFGGSGYLIVMGRGNRNTYTQLLRVDIVRLSPKRTRDWLRFDVFVPVLHVGKSA